MVDVWKGIEGLIKEILRCEAAGAITASLSMAYICIDVMAYLAMPEGRASQTRKDFIDWVESYLEADNRQPYQYVGIDVYAARCSVLHVYGSRSQLHYKDQSVKVFGYHDGGMHMVDSDPSTNLVLIGIPSFLTDVISAVEKFIETCKADTELRQRVEGRLQEVLQNFPAPSQE